LIPVPIPKPIPKVELDSKFGFLLIETGNSNSPNYLIKWVGK
jgi:hypothetical protein